MACKRSSLLNPFCILEVMMPRVFLPLYCNWNPRSAAEALCWIFWPGRHCCTYSWIAAAVDLQVAHTPGFVPVNGNTGALGNFQGGLNHGQMIIHKVQCPAPIVCIGGNGGRVLCNQLASCICAPSSCHRDHDKDAKLISFWKTCCTWSSLKGLILQEPMSGQGTE